MIVVDSSVWIGHLRGTASAPVSRLRILVETDDILVGDLVLMEVLRGARDASHAARIERNLRQFTIVAMLDDRLAVIAARHYRTLRGHGVTPPKAADLLIGTFCIEHGHALLHEDRDFAPMVGHLGLRLA